MHRNKSLGSLIYRLGSFVLGFIGYALGILAVFSIPLVIIYGILGIIGGFLWTYVINTWLVYFGYVPCVLFWHGFLLGIIPKVGYLSIVCSIITFIAMLILV